MGIILKCEVKMRKKHAFVANVAEQNVYVSVWHVLKYDYKNLTSIITRGYYPERYIYIETT